MKSRFKTICRGECPNRLKSDFLSLSLAILAAHASGVAIAAPGFVEVSRAAGVWRTGIGWGVSWIDIDGDGDMDLLQPYHDLGEPFLYLNKGNGVFDDASRMIPPRPYADNHVWRWADIDNDGRPDLTSGVGSTGGHSFNYFEVFLNKGGGALEDVTGRVKLGDLKTRGRAITWFDADNDGLLDALLTAHLPLKKEAKYEGFRGAQLYRNRGGLIFEDVSDASGIHHEGHSYWCAPGDFDNDGDMDLFIQHHGERPCLFENLGGMRFRNIAGEQPFGDLERVCDVDWVDYDADGDLDLYISQGVSGRNGTAEGYLAVANEARFYFMRDGEKDAADEIVIETDASRVDIRNCEEFHEVIFGRRILRPGPEQYRIGRAAKPAAALPVEINRNPDLRNADDLVAPEAALTSEPGVYVWRPADEVAWRIRYVRGLDRQGREYSARVVFNAPIRSARMIDCEFQERPNFLYENRNGRFADVTATVGLAEDENTGDATWQDFDNDGDIDLLLARVSFSYRGASPFVFFENTGGKRFRRVESGLGLERSVIPSRSGVACADYDNDGWLDLAVGAGLSNPPLRFGDSGLWRNLGGLNHWLKVRLRGTKSNADAIGAWVTLEAGGKKQTRYHIAGQSFDGQDSPVIHFGLGSAPMADSVTVTWPGGGSQTRRSVAADQEIVIAEK